MRIGHGFVVRWMAIDASHVEVLYPVSHRGPVVCSKPKQDISTEFSETSKARAAMFGHVP